MINAIIENVRNWFRKNRSTPSSDTPVTRALSNHGDERAIEEQAGVEGLEIDTAVQRESERSRSRYNRNRNRRRKKRPSPSNETGSTSEEVMLGGLSGEPWDLSLFQVPEVEGKTRFHDLDLPLELMRAIYDLGFEYCTPIQAALLPQVLTGVDAAGRAQTGTGKSAVFLINALTHLMRRGALNERRNGSPRALILAPTRELALQIEKDGKALAKYTPFKVISIFGGMDYEKQKRLLTSGHPDVVVATPGRLLDFQRQGDIHLNEVEILVIDEADRMLDMGFIPDVQRIIRSTPPKARRQTMLFSATLTPEVTRFASQWTKDPVTAEIEPEQVAVDTIHQVVYLTTLEEKFTLMLNMIVQQDLERVIVFCNRRDQTRKVTEKLQAYGISCAHLSGEVEQKKRIRTLESFRSGQIRVLVATDVAARGLHIEGISHVVNYTLPLNPEDYVHRIGRTGRAGASGTSVSFACEEDSFQLPCIEKFIGRELSCSYPQEEWLKALPPVKKAPSLPPDRAASPRGDRRNGSGSRSASNRSGFRRSGPKKASRSAS